MVSKHVLLPKQKLKTQEQGADRICFSTTTGVELRAGHTQTPAPHFIKPLPKTRALRNCFYASEPAILADTGLTRSQPLSPNGSDNGVASLCANLLYFQTTQREAALTSTSVHCQLLSPLAITSPGMRALPCPNRASQGSKKLDSAVHVWVVKL